jgi:hypothetical protein
MFYVSVIFYSINYFTGSLAKNSSQRSNERPQFVGHAKPGIADDVAANLALK